MKYRIKVFSAVMCLIMGVFSAGCGKKAETVLDPREPVVINLWHSYNAYAKKEFEQKILEFNETLGKEKGIIIDTFGYGSSEELDRALFNSANKMIGSETLPDIFLAYPDSASRLDSLAPLVAFDKYFSEDELGEYRTEFLGEGIWGEQAAPKMIPVSKSTELLYLNATKWEEFSADTGISEEALKSWEGIAMASEEYYSWSGGEAFFGMNSFNDFALLSAAQLGTFVYQESDGKTVFHYPEEIAKKVWDVYYTPHIKGYYKSNTFNQDGIKSGRLMAYVGSSAGAGYFPPEVIVDGSFSYPIECRVLPYPVFLDGYGYMTQRGANMAVFASEPAREYAAVEFLKWFTEPEQNIEFTISTGYIPVKKAALSSPEALQDYVSGSNNRDAVKKSVATVLEAMNERGFYTKNIFEHAYEANLLFSESLDQKIQLDLNEMALRIERGGERSAIISELTGDKEFEQWYHKLIQEMAGKLDE